jgi:hypothetical protein
MEYNKDSDKWKLETAVFVSMEGDLEMEFGRDALEDKSPLKDLGGLFGDLYKN